MFNVLTAPTFCDVHSEVVERADRSLPDAVTHVADIRFDEDGLLHAPSLPPLRPNRWATRQLASMLGVRWQTWFSDAI